MENNILKTIEAGTFTIEDSFEDVHSKVEWLLTEKLGDAGKKIHTARSRNDQVLVAMHLFLKEELLTIKNLCLALFDGLMQTAAKHKDVALPGYTHLQVAMPSSFGLWFGAILFNIGWVIAGVGGARLDDTMVGVSDCQDLGKQLLIVGPMLWAIGLCMVVMTCDWEWAEDIEALNPEHFDQRSNDKTADSRIPGDGQGQ